PAQILTGSCGSTASPCCRRSGTPPSPEPRPLPDPGERRREIGVCVNAHGSERIPPTLSRPWRRAMEAGSAAPRSFDHLREHSIGLAQVVFQSVTHMAPAAAVAYSIYISVPYSRQALPRALGRALIACICAATAIGQLAKLFPSAGGLYTYAGKSLGGWAGFLVAWLFVVFQPLVAPFLYLEFGWAMSEVFTNSVGWHYSGQWWIWVVLM